jgi:hypothetical protein
MMLTRGRGGAHGGRRSESVDGVVGLGSAGTRVKWHGRLLSLARRARERGMRPVAKWALGHFQRNWARRYSSGLVGRSQRAGRFTLFLLFTSFSINFKAWVSKIQITFLLNSKNFQIWQVDG